MQGEGQMSARSPMTAARFAIVVLGAAMVLVGAVVGVFSWTHPTRAGKSLSYMQSGRFSYSTATDASSIYGSTGLSTGQPIYLSQLSSIDVGFSYRFASSTTARLAETEQLVAKMNNGQGITRVIPLQSTGAFKGTSFQSHATLQLALLQSVVTSFDSVAGGAGEGSYSLAIYPTVSVQGRLGAAALRTAFDAPITFGFDSGVLTPSASTSSTPPASGPSPSQSSPSGADAQFSPSTTGTVAIRGGAPAKLLFGLPVADARIAALVLLFVGLCLGTSAMWPLFQAATSDDERVRIATRYSSALVESESLPQSPDVVVVGLSSFDGLLQVARRLELPILHKAAELDTYAVVDTGTLYRYEGCPHEDETETPPVLDPHEGFGDGHAREEEFSSTFQALSLNGKTPVGRLGSA